MTQMVLRKPPAPARHSAAIGLPEGLKEELAGKAGFCEDGFVFCAACACNA
jgi:hypothetical protein